MEYLQAVNFTTLAWAICKGVGCGLLAGLLLLALGSRFGLLRRVGKIHNLAVKLYYFYLPVVCAGLGALWLSLGAVEKEMLAVSGQIRPAAVAFTTESAKNWLEAIQEKFPAGAVSIKDLGRYAMSEQIEKRLSAALEERLTLPEFMSGIKDNISDLLADITLEAVEDRLLEKASDTTSMDVELLRAIWQTDIIGGMQNGLVMDIFDNYIRNTFTAFRGKALLLGVLLLAPVFLEWGLSVYFSRRRKPA